MTNRYIFFALMSTISLFFLYEITFADDPVNPQGNWYRLERILNEQGFGTSPEELLEIIREASGPHAAYAATIAGLRGDSAAIKSLETAANDKENDAFLRERAAIALARLGEDQGILLIRSFMNNSGDLERQISLAGSLAEMGCADGYPRIITAIFNGNANTRLAVLDEIRYFDLINNKIKYNPKPSSILKNFLLDNDEWIRKNALLQTSLISSEEFDVGALKFEVCRIALADPSPSLRDLAKGVILSWRSDKLLLCNNKDLLP